MSVQITMTLNGETREVETFWVGSGLCLGGIEIMTKTGKKANRGIVFLKANPENIYTERDITSVDYGGMRGNGYAQVSKIRYIGFAKVAA